MLIQGSQKTALRMELGTLCAPVIHLLARAVLQTLRKERSNYGCHVILVGQLISKCRYCSMDYVLLSTLMGITIAMLVVSYDVACQWSINFASHLAVFPVAMQFKISNVFFTTVIPKFHILGHGPQCQSTWSLNFRRWMGRTDGEGVEHEWSHINPVALSTK